MEVNRIMYVIVKCSRLLISLVFLGGLSACSSVDYFSHLAKGQFSLLWARQDIEELLVSEHVSEELKSRLLLSQSIRHFAEEELYLPVGDAYSAYADLKRPYVIWNVYAAPALSFESYTWCYPILGCMAYRGFYDEQRAQVLANQLEEEGLDVKVGGVKAYSTLGFFEDPLLNTFMFKNEVALVELLIHEISHRQIYINDDTKFNENFATAVALLGAEQWYSKQSNMALFENYQEYKQNQQALVDFLLTFKQRLAEVYENTELSDAEKLHGKESLFKSLHLDYETFKYAHHLDNRFDAWVSSLNNASLSTLANYQELVPGFLALFQKKNANWKEFYQAVEELSRLEKEERHKALIEFSEN